ncbi:MAG: molybdenum cofactor guanylyltransferase [Erythrobacter sp.]
MRILGAVLAGGRSTRFGSDKAHALIGGERLIDRVAESIENQCDALIVCGREEAGYSCVPDLPASDLGPLGGLNAALAHAAANGFSHVLSVPCDAPNLPRTLAQKLIGEGAAIAENQPVIGLWPANLSDDLASFVGEGGRALYRFADRAKARQIGFDPPLANINRPADLPG